MITNILYSALSPSIIYIYYIDNYKIRKIMELQHNENPS